MISLSSLPDSTTTHSMGLFQIKDQIIIEYRIQSLCCYNFVIGIETGSTLVEVSLDSEKIEVIEAFDSDAKALKEIIKTPPYDESYHRLVFKREEGLEFDRRPIIGDIGSRLFKAHYATPYITLTSKDNIEKKISINIYSI